MSQIIEKAKENQKTYSMELIVFPLFLIMFVGLIGNAMTNSGLGQNIQIGQTNNCLLNGVSCNFTISPTNSNVGCETSTNCQLSQAQSFNLLTGSSPWTLLFQGNILGAIQTWLSPQSSNPQGQISGYVLAFCVPLNTEGYPFNATNLQTITKFICPNIFNGEVQNVTTLNNGASLPFLLIGGGNNTIYSIYAFNNNTAPPYCNGAPCMRIKTYGLDNPYSYNFSFPATMSYCSNQVFIANSAICYGTKQSLWYNQTSETFTDYQAYTLYSSNAYFASTNGNSGSGFQLPSAFSFLGLLFGVLLLVMALGINLSGSIEALASGVAAGIGVNDNGSRLALILGSGLVLFSFFTSEFSLAFASLAGTLGTGIFLLLTSMFFFGLIWRIYSLD